MKNLTFRKALPQDQTIIWPLFQDAILRRAREGSEQWQDGYPNPDSIAADIANGNGYVVTENEDILAYAAIIRNDEPAYQNIEGVWLSEQDFVVLHRIVVAKGQTGRGLTYSIFEFAEEIARKNSIFSMKVDTNFDNHAMLKILKNLGYTYCGEVYYRGSSRMAFEKLLS